MRDEVFMKRWSRIIEKGYINYMLPRIILAASFGIIGGFLVVYLSYITWNKEAFNSIMLYIASGVIGSVIGIFIAANSSWKVSRKRYYKIIGNK